MDRYGFNCVFVSYQASISHIEKTARFSSSNHLESALKTLEASNSKKPVIEVFPSRPEGNKTIVVLGVERGGTSMVAGVIRALGFNLGEQAGRNHEDPRFLTDDTDKLIKIIEANNKNSKVWGFKMPKASLKLGFYNQHLRNPYYILVYRNIASVVDSWCSRGANDPLATARHSLNYYATSLKDLQDFHRPLLFVNYERACDQKEPFITELCEFLRKELNKEELARAVSVIVDDGGGYVDIPEYYFHISEHNPNRVLDEAYPVTFEGDSDQYCLQGAKKVKNRIVLLPEDDYFPKEMFMKFTLGVKDRGFLKERKLRVYMDFSDRLFPGHAFRPVIHEGENLLCITNNGNVKRIALGPLSNDEEYSLTNILLARSAQWEDQGDGDVLSGRYTGTRYSSKFGAFLKRMLMALQRRR